MLATRYSRWTYGPTLIIEMFFCIIIGGVHILYINSSDIVLSL